MCSLLVAMTFVDEEVCHGGVQMLGASTDSVVLIRIALKRNIEGGYYVWGLGMDVKISFATDIHSTLCAMYSDPDHNGQS